MKALAPAIGLIQTCVFLGGTIVVFGKFFMSFFKIVLLDRASCFIAFRKVVIKPGPYFYLFTGWYSHWTYDIDKKGIEGYCAYPPFMFAFVLLIIEWILMPLFICGICCMICGKALMGNNSLNH